MRAKFLFNRASHPDAARLFLNWVLTREGQEVWSNASRVNSLRADVPPVVPEPLPTPDKPALNFSHESTSPTR